MNKLAKLLTIFIIFLSACSNADDVARLPSPSGKVEAILTEKNSGAATSFLYNVYLVSVTVPEKKIHIAQIHGATRSENSYGINLIWLSENRLELQYYEAKAVKYIKDEIVVDNITYNITSKSGAIDKSAPPGGMLYNLKGRPYG